MAGIFLAKRATINLTKASSKEHARYIDFATRTSASYVQAAQGRNTVTDQARWEGPDPTGSTPGVSSGAKNDPTRQGMYDSKQSGLDKEDDRGRGATQFMADTVKEGVRKATEIADALGDSAKKTVDGAWDAAKEGNQRIRETVADSGNNDKYNNNTNNHANDNNTANPDPVVVEMHKIDGPIDTVEYRNIEQNMDDLKKVGDRAD
ncbi:hypothetical protein Tsubulata_006431 [Turnera subulata]|uniref:Uncharacterized protein n=1 Tax=Turnera subulata TaxID=218843 RepID=A0A9Q0JGS7_9ROSI|nr:hypothetical protein Tsubulata_006431 [Turnera subulata]